MPPRISSARPGAAASGGFTRVTKGAFKPPRPRTVHEVADDSDNDNDNDDNDDDDDDDDAGSPTDAATDDEDFPEVPVSKRTAPAKNKGSRASQNSAKPKGGGRTSNAPLPIDVDDDDQDNDDDDTASKSLPPALLARLMHHFFQNPAPAPTRLTQDAHVAVGKYMEIFVREAVARSVAERRGDGGGFLDVDVLQKVAGQLIMDM